MLLWAHPDSLGLDLPRPVVPSQAGRAMPTDSMGCQKGRITPQPGSTSVTGVPGCGTECVSEEGAILQFPIIMSL